jgi:hypothetical protein
MSPATRPYSEQPSSPIRKPNRQRGARLARARACLAASPRPPPATAVCLPLAASHRFLFHLTSSASTRQDGVLLEPVRPTCPRLTTPPTDLRVNDDGPCGPLEKSAAARLLPHMTGLRARAHAPRLALEAARTLTVGPKAGSIAAPHVTARCADRLDWMTSSCWAHRLRLVHCVAAEPRVRSRLGHCSQFGPKQSGSILLAHQLGWSNTVTGKCSWHLNAVTASSEPASGRFPVLMQRAASSDSLAIARVRPNKKHAGFSCGFTVRCGRQQRCSGHPRPPGVSRVQSPARSAR